jgi:hypothetical protein
MLEPMWLAIPLPTLESGHASGRLAKLHASVGSRLEAGDLLADVTIDLSAGITRDCPPVSTVRIVLQEAAWLREILISADAPSPAGSLVALLSTEADSPVEAPSRRARTTIAAILHHEQWWAPQR